MMGLGLARTASLGGHAGISPEGDSSFFEHHVWNHDYQLSMLSIEGCDEVQGYLLGRPMPIDQIIGSGQITVKPGTPAAAARVRAEPIADAPAPLPQVAQG